ncbi:MAG: amidohydrolase [Burkholderiales bacterium]|nr:amidohydrolase [Burkholderiales bacterium]
MADKEFDVVEMRTELHKMPELGMHETKTSDYLAKKLEEMGLKPQRGIGGTGMVAYIEGTEPGPTVMLRADMDALPFTIDGKPTAIHACGHDCHMAMALATAAKLRGKVKKGKVKIFFQPAEETLEGAEACIKDGVLDDVDIAYGAHVRPVQDIPDGTVCAAVKHTASTFCRIELKGQTAHGARPHLGKSVVEAAVLITNAINSIWVNPLKGWSAKVTSIDCRSNASNIIPDKGTMLVDIRAEDNPTMDELLEKLKKAIAGAADAVGVQANVIFPGGVLPAPIYDEGLVENARETIKKVLGDDKLAKDCGGGGEDFHFFVQKKPSLKTCYIGVGAGVTPGLHDPTMTLNPESLRNGVDVLEQLILNQVG